MKTISKEVLDFLNDLKNNNDRDWFNDHKNRFKLLEQEMKQFYAEIENGLNHSDQIERTKAYRIYRDIRFSKDKTPYKQHFAAIFIRKKPALRGSYYLHIQPGGRSQIGGGFWQPSKEDLKRVRKEWEIDAQEIREILDDNRFSKYWGKMQGEQLKTAPMGFDKAHPDIDLINYKQWLFRHTFTDEEVLADDFGTKVVDHFVQIRPFFDYMSSLLTTDLNGVSLIQ